MTTTATYISREQVLEAIPQIKSGLKRTAQLFIDDATEGDRHRPYDYGMASADAVPATNLITQFNEQANKVPDSELRQASVNLLKAVGGVESAIPDPGKEPGKRSSITKVIESEVREFLREVQEAAEKLFTLTI